MVVGKQIWLPNTNDLRTSLIHLYKILQPIKDTQGILEDHVGYAQSEVNLM